MESLDEGAEGDADAYDAEEHAQEDDETVVGNSAPVKSRSFQLQVEVTGPDEREHSAGETSDQAHEDGKVRDPDGHQDGEDHHAHAKGKPPHLELTVKRPHGRESGLRPAFETRPLHQVQRCVVRQRI